MYGVERRVEKVLKRSHTLAAKEQVQANPMDNKKHDEDSA